MDGRCFGNRDNVSSGDTDHQPIQSFRFQDVSLFLGNICPDGGAEESFSGMQEDPSTFNKYW